MKGDLRCRRDAGLVSDRSGLKNAHPSGIVGRGQERGARRCGVSRPARSRDRNDQNRRLVAERRGSPMAAQAAAAGGGPGTVSSGCITRVTASGRRRTHLAAAVSDPRHCPARASRRPWAPTDRRTVAGPSGPGGVPARTPCWRRIAVAESRPPTTGQAPPPTAPSRHSPLPRSSAPAQADAYPAPPAPESG